MRTAPIRWSSAVAAVLTVHSLAVFSQTRQDSTTRTVMDSVRSIPDFEEISDRWRDIVPPPSEYNVAGRWYDPYNQNIAKGDYPILGQNTFLVFALSVDNFGAVADVPTPSGVSALEQGSDAFFGRSDRFLVNEKVRLTLELYHGDVAYRPRDWEVRITPVFDYNYTRLRENNGVNVNVRKGSDRSDNHLGFQELSVEKHLFNVTDRYDFLSARAGIQRFSSDFRGFVFSDFNLGGRIFGSLDNNRVQFNAIVLPMLEKETNSELNTVFDDRGQTVAIANVYLHDYITSGYTSEFSFHYNDDRASVHFDENGFPVRPSIVGNTRPHAVQALYAGWSGDGHLGRVNLTHTFYYAFGKDDFNSLAGRQIDIAAYMAALEISIDRDWMRFALAGLYASGDDKPSDGTGGGFDSIIDEPFFAGGPFSYWFSQGIGLQAVGLVQKQSFLPNLRSNKFEGQSNFVNPGLLLVNAEFTAEVTQELKGVLNVNFLRFDKTEVLVEFTHQNSLHKNIGIDFGAGVVYRPFLNNNAILAVGLTGLQPLDGWKDLYESSKLRIASFVSLILTY